MKKYFWLLCLGGMLGACHSSNHSQKDTAEATGETVAYDPGFQKFANQFKTASLPYTLDTAQLANHYEEESLIGKDRWKSIDKAFVKTYVNSTKIEDLQSYLENYLKEKDTKALESVAEENPDEEAGMGGNSRTYFYYISKPIQNAAFTALVIGCYDSGLEMCGSGTTAYAFLCTFNPKGQFISSMLLAEDLEGADLPVYGSTVTKGTIGTDLAIETKTTQVEGEYIENEKPPKETVTHTIQKYQIAGDGTIKQLSGEQNLGVH